MLNFLNSYENSHQFPLKLKRFHPSYTIESELKNQKAREHTIQDLLNFKFCGNIQSSQPVFQRNFIIKSSLKLTKITPSVTEQGDNCTSTKKRTISLENFKKVEFHPQVLIIYSENGIKKREKLIDECRVKRTCTRKNCIILNKKK